VRPSGTEPKMKVYLAVKGNSLENSEAEILRFKEKVMEIINYLYSINFCYRIIS
ncbi:Phosphomannomutase, partial [human gut metagenome]